jgi:lipopolysaccharide/colanic/teichoic acid biosynthesis glycosyltransferase
MKNNNIVPVKRVTILRDSLLATITLSAIYAMYVWILDIKVPLDVAYQNFYFIYLLNWLVFALYFKLPKIYVCTSRRMALKIITLHSFLSFLSMNLIVVLCDLRVISRLFFLLILMTPILIQAIGVLVYKNFPTNGTDLVEEPTSYKIFDYTANLGYKKAILSAFLLLGTTYATLYFKTGSFLSYQYYDRLLGLLLVSWIISAFLTGKFDSNKGASFYYKIGPHTKSLILMLFFLAAFQYLTGQEEVSRGMIYGIALGAGTLEVLLLSIWHRWRTEDKLEQQNLDIINEVRQTTLDLSQQKLINRGSTILEDIVRNLSMVSTGVNRNFIRLTKQVFSNANPINEKYEVLFSSRIQTMQVHDIEYYGIILNLELLNNIRHLNQYMMFCHKNITVDGYLFGSYEPLEMVRKNYRKMMPRFIYIILYPLYFLFHRILPKLPKIRHLYFIITKGKNRNISRAEVLGRLSYCGFSDIEEIESKGIRYFAARKTNTISNEPFPSYGPIIGLERICLHGEKKRIYKLRTMHPYSEFIQKDVFIENSLGEKGKIENDFRRTYWGTLLRKYWIDELPQLYNWLKGDVELVGVRALSLHFYSLYPDDVQQLRTKVKPGLVPPFYADMPQTFDDIIDSERNYLLQKLEAPIRTDVKYFFKAFFNIIFRSARSE